MKWHCLPSLFISLFNSSDHLLITYVFMIMIIKYSLHILYSHYLISFPLENWCHTYWLHSYFFVLIVHLVLLMCIFHHLLELSLLNKQAIHHHIFYLPFSLLTMSQDLNEKLNLLMFHLIFLLYFFINAFLPPPPLFDVVI